MRIVDYLLDLLWPPHCAVCGARTDSNPVCDDCLHSMDIELKAYCPDCGDCIDEFRKCPKHSNPVYPYYLPLYLFNDRIRELIHLVKYSGRKDVGFFLGDMLAEEILKRDKFDDYDVLIPVPLHPIRYRERGYNQCTVIGKAFAKKAGIEMLEKAIIRIKNTKSQTKLDSQQRTDNIAKAFRIDSDLSGKNIIILDDVITTGATTRELAATIVEAGGRIKYALCLAHPSTDESKNNDI